jgi:hypothetical protein
VVLLLLGERVLNLMVEDDLIELSCNYYFQPKHQIKRLNLKFKPLQTVYNTSKVLASISREIFPSPTLRNQQPPSYQQPQTLNWPCPTDFPFTQLFQLNQKIHPKLDSTVKSKFPRSSMPAADVHPATTSVEGSPMSWIKIRELPLFPGTLHYQHPKHVCPLFFYCKKMIGRDVESEGFEIK